MVAFIHIPLDSTGRTFILKENVLTPGSQYLVSLTITNSTDISFGPAYYEFMVNLPPRNGSCRILAYDYYLGFLMETGYEIPNATINSGQFCSI